MSKDHSERRTYRRSPGRQYGYEYDPLRNRSEQSQSGKIDNDGLREPGTTRGETASKSGSLSAQRPDLRRTRQLLRQNIIATKARLVEEEEGGEQEEFQDSEQPLEHIPEYNEEEDTTLYHKRYPTRSGRLVQRPTPERQPIETQEDTWEDAGDVDPDLGYEEVDPLDARMGYIEGRPRYAPNRPVQTRQGRPTHSIRPIEPEDDYYDDEYDKDYYEEEVRRPPAQRKDKKRKMSRRGLLIGATVVAIGGAGAAIYEMAPKLPQVVGNAAQNVEQQVQDAFQQGVAKGANDARQEFITALESLEGFTLNAAIAAAKLTRVAYDVFVSPIVQFGSTVGSNFLTVMLNALKTARGLLAQVYMDNSTMIAIQKVLEAWVSKVGSMPKQLNAIADTDLDGAQSYLTALQTKIAQEKAKLNNPQATPTPQPTQKAKNQ
jgi:hypothetical protein